MTKAEQRSAQAAEFYVYRLRKQFDEVSARTFPTGQSSVQKVLNLVDGLLKTAEKRLTPSRNNPQTAATIEDAFDCAREAYYLLQLMEGSDVSDLDHSAVSPMQRWFTGLVSPQRTIFFRAENVANYEIRSIDKISYSGIRKRSPALTKAISAIRWPLTRVTVPTRALSILPHLSIVAHELGHVIYRGSPANSIESAVNSALVANKPRIDIAFQQFLVHAQNHLGTKFDARLVATIGNRILFGASGRSAGWHEEIAADAIAFALTGPAIFFALSDMLSFISKSDLYSQSHPPTYLRRKFLFELLGSQKYDFVGMIEKHLGEDVTQDFNSPLMPALRNRDDLFVAFENRVGSEMAAVLSGLPIVVEVTGPIVCEAVQNHFDSRPKFRKHRYTPNKFGNDLDNYLVPVLAGVPPIETGNDLSNLEAAEFATILNVGWIALLCRLQDFMPKAAQSSLPNGEKSESLHRLLIKAVELSEIKRQWDEI